MSKLLPYETIVKAHEGDPGAIDTVLSHYAGYIRYFSKVHGQVTGTKEETLVGLKEIVPVIRDRQTREIVESTIRKLDAIPEPECRRFIADGDCGEYHPKAGRHPGAGVPPLYR